MAGDIDDVIHPPGDPVVAILIPPAAVARKILARIVRKIGVDEALVVPIDRPHLARPGVTEDKYTLASPLHNSAVMVHDGRLNTEERPRG